MRSPRGSPGPCEDGHCAAGSDVAAPPASTRQQPVRWSLSAKHAIAAPPSGSKLSTYPAAHAAGGGTGGGVGGVVGGVSVAAGEVAVVGGAVVAEGAGAGCELQATQTIAIHTKLGLLICLGSSGAGDSASSWQNDTAGRVVPDSRRYGVARRSSRSGRAGRGDQHRS